MVQATQETTGNSCHYFPSQPAPCMQRPQAPTGPTPRCSWSWTVPTLWSAIALSPAKTGRCLTAETSASILSCCPCIWEFFQVETAAEDVEDNNGHRCTPHPRACWRTTAVSTRGYELWFPHLGYELIRSRFRCIILSCCFFLRPYRGEQPHCKYPPQNHLPCSLHGIPVRFRWVAGRGSSWL